MLRIDILWQLLDALAPEEAVLVGPPPPGAPAAVGHPAVGGGPVGEDQDVLLDTVLALDAHADALVAGGLVL